MVKKKLVAKKRFLVTLFLVLLVLPVAAQDVAPRPGNPVNIWSPILVGSGSLVTVGGVVLLSGVVDAKNASDDAYAAWLLDPSTANTTSKTNALTRFYSSFGFGLLFSLGGFGITMAGIGLGEGANDFFLIPPPATKQGFSLGIEPGPGAVFLVLRK